MVIKFNFGVTGDYETVWEIHSNSHLMLVRFFCFFPYVYELHDRIIDFNYSYLVPAEDKIYWQQDCHPYTNCNTDSVHTRYSTSTVFVSLIVDYSYTLDTASRGNG